MNKSVKRKFVGTIICLIIGTLTLAYEIINYGNIKEELNSYLSGFAVGLISVGLYFMYQSIKFIRHPEKGKEFENKENDERIKMISNTSMAITLKLSIMVEAFTSIILAFLGKMEIAEYIGFIISIQLLIYIISYYYIENKN